jgi:hypothetical protein
MSGHMYIYKPENTTDYMSVGVNGVYTTFSSLKTDNRILDAGYVTTSDVVTIGCDPASSFTVYILDEEKFLQAYNKLNSNAFVVDSYTTTSFTGTVTTSSDGTFLFSIPFDKGWSVYIDGKKCTTYAAFDALLATDLTAGTHTVKLKYTPVNYVFGCIISVLCIIILIVIHLAKKFVYKEIIEDSELPAIVIDLLNNEDVISQREPKKIATMAELNEMDDFDNIVLEDEEYVNEAESDDYSEGSNDTASGGQETLTQESEEIKK